MNLLAGLIWRTNIHVTDNAFLTVTDNIHDNIHVTDNNVYNFSLIFQKLIEKFSLIFLSYKNVN